MALSEEFENVIVLGDEFYNEIRAHAISTDIEAVKVFAAAPAAMDLFMWLAYRCFIARCEERIPLFGDFGLTAQLGTVEYSRPRRFRAILEQWLATILVVWPDCPRESVPTVGLCAWLLPPLSCRRPGDDTGFYVRFWSEKEVVSRKYSDEASKTY